MGMFADRMSSVQVSATLKVAAEAERLRRAGHNVVDFSAGEPDFPTPEHVKAAAKEAIEQDDVGVAFADGCKNRFPVDRPCQAARDEDRAIAEIGDACPGSAA